ncbi:MAG: hypothetical protein ACOCRO_04545 [Halanaerobiales bacterium]
MDFFSFFKKEKKDANDSSSFVGGQIGSFLSRNHANATNAAIEGMDLFRNAANNLSNVDIKIKQGNLFEYIEATKFNIDSAIKNSGLKAVLTAEEGKPHAAADILIKKDNKVVEKIQAKSYNRAKDATYRISNGKYRNMQKLVNSDKADRVKELATKRSVPGTLKEKDYRDTAKNVTGKLNKDNVSSAGTSYDEMLDAAKNPEKYANKIEFKKMTNEIKITSVQAAKAGVLIGGAISIAKNGIKLSKGEIEARDATINVIKDSGKAGVRSGATGTLGAGIRVTAQKAGLNGLAKANVATSIASGVINIGSTVYSFAKGDINLEKAVENIGETGLSTTSGIYYGAVSGLVFGPAGAIAGSIAGYLIATNVYQSCIAILKDVKLAEEESERVIALCNAAIIEIGNQRKEFENLVEQKLEMNKQVFDKCFSDIDSAFNLDNPDLVVFSLSNLTQYFGEKLKLINFDDFDNYMKNNDELTL